MILSIVIMTPFIILKNLFKKNKDYNFYFYLNQMFIIAILIVNLLNYREFFITLKFLKYIMKPEDKV